MTTDIIRIPDGTVTAAASWPERVEALCYQFRLYLEGDVSANTRALYLPHFREYLEFAGAEAAIWYPSTLERWKVALFQAGYTVGGQHKDYTVSSLNARLASVRKAVEAFAAKGHIPAGLVDEFSLVKNFKQRANKERRKQHARVGLSREDFGAVLREVDANTHEGARLMHRALLLTIGLAGLRITSAVTLRRDQLHWHEDAEYGAGWVVEVLDKNDVEPRRVPLAKDAKAAVDAWLAYRREVLGVDVPAVFTGFGGRGDRDPSSEPISRVSAWEMVTRYTQRAGLQHVKPHDFRRFVGTQLARRDIRLAQKVLGHKDISTTARHYVIDGVPVGVTDGLLS